MKKIALMGSIIISLIFPSCTETIEKNEKTAVEKESTQENIEFQIMVQRATQTAIWAMPGVALVDFIKSTRRDLGGD